MMTQDEWPYAEKATLIGYTQFDPDSDLADIFRSYQLDDNSNDALNLITYCARVSNPSNQYNMNTAEKLVEYLIREAHWSPFEMVNAVMEVETTRDISRQLLRHGFKFQEFSQRYADPTKDMGFVKREARLQDHKNRQNSIDLDQDQSELQGQWIDQQQAVMGASLKAYKWAVDNGIAKEQARAVLPEGLTISRLYVQGTIRNWIHYISIRSEEGTQKEHRILAQLCAEAIHKIFSPIVHYTRTD